MIKYSEDGCIDLKKSSLRDIRDHFMGSVLSRFVEEGGQGIKSELWELIIVTLAWKKEHPDG